MTAQLAPAGNHPDPGMSRRSKVLIALAVAAAALVGAGVFVAARRATHPHQVVYTVTGSAKQADITYTASDGTTQQQTGVDVPIVNSATGQQGLTVRLKSGDFFSIMAQNVSSAGDLTCTVTDDGAVIQQHAAYGAAAIADCHGAVP